VGRSSVLVLLVLAACGNDLRTAGDVPSADGGDTGVEAGAPRVDGGSSLPDDTAPDANAPAGTPVAEHGALHVASGKIVDAHGNPFAPRGMSLFWSQWGNTFWNASAIGSLRSDWHATVVRAAMGVESGGYLEDAARETGRVVTVVDAATAEGMYVLVDWHDHHADQHADAAKTFFGEMADRYKSSPNVVFEIWNEPVDVSWATVKTYATDVIGTIRAHGAQNLVIVGSPHWSQDVDVVATDPLSDGNVAYAIHFYANTPAHQAPLRAKADVALGKGLALFASEWGTCSSDGNGEVNPTESQLWLDYLKGHQIGWCNWSLFDKPEAASALVSGASTSGPWGDDALTASGKFVKAALAKE
jgi:endoglucanase